MVDNMVTININGKEIKLKEPVTILEAAKANGIKIPHFCYHPILEKWGSCRMCLVEVEKMPRLQTACTLTVTDGMVIKTESPDITKARKAMLEFLLANHPLDCPVCDKAGECKLQDYTMLYGPTAGRFKETKIRHAESVEDPLIVRNPERCIMCTRCVRMCDEVQGASAIAINGRGNHSTVEPFSGGKFNCEYCGNCLAVCPVGAIMSRLHRYKYRAWQMDREVKTVCSYCGVGCTLMVQVRDNNISRITPRIGPGLNKGLLCNRGRFGYEYVNSAERLSTPLVRKNGTLEPASWDEALSTVAQRLTEIKNSHGGKAISGIASARCTNEDNYLFQKLLRLGFDTNNIDSIARMGFAGAQSILETTLGQGATANPISGILNSDAILVIESDPAQINPVLGIHVRMASRKGAKVLTIGHIPGLQMHRTAGLLPRPHTEKILIAGLIAGILKNKPLEGNKPSGGNHNPLEEKINSLALPSPEEVEKACNLSRDEIDNILKELTGASSVCLVIGRETGGHADKVSLVAILAYILNARVYLMSERPNEQGLIDMGCLPDMLPGGRPLEAESFRKRYEDIWGMQIPSEKGLTLMETMDAAASGSIKAMYVVGENPAFSLPDSNRMQEALSKLKFLVVQDIFMTETARMADVVLPALSWAEKDGTYTNLERRLQILKKAVDGQGLPDWRIFVEIGKRTGLQMPYGSTEDIMEEISSVSPLHANLTYEDIENGSGLWPYKGEPLRGGAGLPELTPDAFKAPEPQELYLMVEKPLFHSGTLSRKSPALNSICPEAVAKLGAETAAGLGLKDGDTAEISTEKGTLKLKVKVDGSLNGSTVLLSNNFEGKGAFALMGYTLDPVTKAPVLESRQVTIAPASQKE